MPRKRIDLRQKRPAPLGTVATEIRQSKPFASPEREASVTLLRTGDVLHHAVESALRPFGLSNEQYNVLRILKGAGEQGLPTLEIAERMVARSPNITRLVDKMAAKGLAERHQAEGDRRVVRVTATPRGRKALEELDRAIETVLAKLSPLGASRLGSLVRLLDAVRRRLAVPTVRESIAGKQRG